MKDMTHEDAAFALNQLLQAVENGEDAGGGIRRFLRLWTTGKSLEQFTFDPGTPAHIGLMLTGLYAFIAKSEATVRPVTFGKHKAVAAVIALH
jgi:hypothetical protein